MSTEETAGRQRSADEQHYQQARLSRPIIISLFSPYSPRFPSLTSDLVTWRAG